MAKPTKGAASKWPPKIRRVDRDDYGLVKKPDLVNHPEHYGGEANPYECIKVLESWLTPEEFAGFCKGNVIKYLARANHKGGAQDVAKADWYGARLAAYQKARK